MSERISPIPSLVTDPTGSDTSPSKLARVSHLFSAWMFRAKVIVVEDPPTEVIAHFNSLHRLEEVPTVLIQGAFPNPTIDKEAHFQRTVREWASTLRPTEGDEFGILDELSHLAFAYSCVRRTSNNDSRGHAQRRGIDNIIHLAFSMRVDRHCNYRTEESYRVAVLNGNPDARSDTLVTIPSAVMNDKIGVHRLSFTDPSIADHLYWSTNGVLDSFSIIGFAGEFKKDNASYNENRLVMVLTTAQLQRRALSLKKAIIMGATSCRGHVQIYSSYWSSNADDPFICIYLHDQQFDLTDPVQVIRLYIFFSKLEKYIQDTLASELREWNATSEMTVKDLMWRSSNQVRKRRRTETGSSAKSGKEGGGNNKMPVDADGFGDDWLGGIMNWRNKVMEDGKDTRAIPEEGEIPIMTGLNSKTDI